MKYITNGDIQAEAFTTAYEKFIGKSLIELDEQLHHQIWDKFGDAPDTGDFRSIMKASIQPYLRDVRKIINKAIDIIVQDGEFADCFLYEVTLP